MKGYLQKLGVNYNKTYAPTAKWISLRIFLTICACLNMFTRQLDVKTAFLYADLDEDVYIQVSMGLRPKDGNPFDLPPEILEMVAGQ